MALSKVLNCWGARLTWTAQKEHVAHVIRGVEAHKAVVAFLYSATRRESAVHRGRAGGEQGLLSNGRTGWGPLGLIDGRGLVCAGVSKDPTA